jgi:hypothetical protein
MHSDEASPHPAGYSTRDCTRAHGEPFIGARDSVGSMERMPILHFGYTDLNGGRLQPNRWDSNSAEAHL